MMPHIPTVLIVADDLTGALDSAVAFTGGRRRVTVARGVGRIEAALREEPVVLAVDTATREGKASAAIEAMEAVARALPLGAVPVILKKVDSRLKGHVRAEVAALRRLSGRTRVVAAPAVPQMDRLQVGGRLFGDSIESSINIAALIGRDVEIPDVETDVAFGAFVHSGDAMTLWVGARGLAFALSRSRFDADLEASTGLSAPALFVVGSRDPVTQAQVDALRRPIYRAPDGFVSDAVLGGPLDVVVMTDGGGWRGPAEAGAIFSNGVADRIRKMRPNTLLLCGGETAAAILERLDVGLLNVLREVAPGVPVAVADVSWGQMTIVTKSGGFGSQGLLQQIASYIT